MRWWRAPAALRPTLTGRISSARISAAARAVAQPDGRVRRFKWKRPPVVPPALALQAPPLASQPRVPRGTGHQAYQLPEHVFHRHLVHSPAITTPTTWHIKTRLSTAIPSESVA